MSARSIHIDPASDGGPAGGSSTRAHNARTEAVDSPPAQHWEVQGAHGHGWECVTGAADREQAEGYLADYQANEPGTAFRITQINR